MSNLAALLRQGEFVVTAELNPPKSASGAAVKRRTGLLKGNVDAVNVTDSNRSVVAMAAIPAALFVREAGVGPSFRSPAATAIASRCRPISSARPRSASPISCS